MDTPGDSSTLYEEKHAGSGTNSNATAPEDSARQVDVACAEEQFNALSRSLTAQSQAHAQKLRADSTVNGDIEKGRDAGEAFDLREYLTSSNDANQKAGIKHKHVGVTWENLQVDVVGDANSKAHIYKYFGQWEKYFCEIEYAHLSTRVLDVILNFFLAPVFWVLGFIEFVFVKKEIATRTILHESSGVLKPGEMCLVLGCPGSGCTTFLKTIANERSDYAKVSGEVLYAGIDAVEIDEHYKGEVVYNQEDDIHVPTLTVAQTLKFALSTKSPGPNGRLPGISRKQFDSQVMETLLRMLNISHTEQTLVGDEFVRGVSGGERKRVSIAEMMATRARVQCWDNSTRGLDASTALDFAKCLRIMTDVLGQTTFVSLYQAGEGIYDLFDKILVLDEGRQVFYGPPPEARKYFEELGYKSLPRQSTADYLTGCTDKNERQFAPGRSSADVPSTPESLEAAYLECRLAETNLHEVEEYKRLIRTEKTDQEAFRAAVAADKKKGVSKKSPYTLGLTGQVWALTVRMFQTRLQDTFQLAVSFSLAIILALTIGAAYFNQPLTSNGAFTRGSLIFAALYTTCLDAFGEMPLQMIGRPILRKQTSYSFYRPAAIALAGTLSDLPFSALRVFLFNVIVYFMSGLHRTAGAFFTFHLFNYTAYLSMQGFFRTLGHLCSNFDAAFRLATFFVPNFIQYSGYMIPVTSMQRWLFWIYYINPVSYAWQACMSNEFMHLELTCDGNSVIPRNGFGLTKYPDELGPNQACTLFGARSGSDIIFGADYLRVGFELDVKDIWRRCFVVGVGFLFAFQLTQVIVLEYLPQLGHPGGVNIFIKENKELEKLNERLRERKAQKLEAADKAGKYDKELDEEDEGADSKIKARQRTFTWERLNYHVPGPNGQIRLLHDIYGYVKPGTLTALMGASGAGKTTCLDVLAQRKNLGVVSGDILVEGRPLTSEFARGTAYAEQMDVHEGTATVREAMRFSAYLRQPSHIPESEKNDYVEEMIELLELQDLADAIVFSLGPEARKRVTIGVELASKPELLLFLDEPTSGLDAQSAWNLVRFLRKLADQGQAILCTIHQPSSLLFESFDRLLLLERGGETVYFGDIGADSAIIRKYFARHGAHCPSNVNPAEYMLEAVGAGVSPRVGDRDWKDIWLDSPELQKVQAEIQSIKDKALSQPAPGKKELSAYATPFWYQLKTIVGRNNKAIWRSSDYIFSRLFVSGCISLYISLSFLQLGNSARDLQFRMFGMFWVVVLPAIVMVQIEPLFISNRRIFIREASSSIYSSYVFAIGQLIGEIPYSIICSILYWVLMVYPMGFGQGAAGLNGTGFQLLIVFFMVLFGVSLGQLVAALSPSVQVAVPWTPFLILVLSTFCGVTIPYPSLISFWRSWLYELNPFTRTLSALISTELHGLPIVCRPDEFVVFNPPAGQTCADWGKAFADTFGGYIDNLTDTVACRYCQFSVGDEYFVPLNISYETRWRDAWLLFAFVVFNLICTIIASRFLRYAKR